MHFPLVREYVRVGGREEGFSVLRCDYKRETADVAGVVSKEELKEIPFASLFAGFDETARSKSHLYQG